MARRAVALAALLVAAWAPGADGKVLLGDALKLSKTSVSNAVVDVAYDSSSDRYLVVWSGAVQGAGGQSLFGRVLDGAARPVSDHFWIAEEGLVQVLPGPPGEFLVLSAAGCRLSGWRLGPTGATIGGRFVIAENACAADAAYNSDRREYLVVWQRDGIRGQRLAADGTPVGAQAFPISNTSTSPYLGRPQVVVNGARNEYVVLWAQPRGFYQSVHGQCLDFAGSEIGADDFITKSLPTTPDEPTEYLWLHHLYYEPVRGHALAVLGHVEWSPYPEAVSFGRWVMGCASDRTGWVLEPEVNNGGGPQGLGTGSFDLAESRFYWIWTKDLNPRAFETDYELFAGPLQGDNQLSRFGRDVGPSQIAYNGRADEHLVVFAGGGTNEGVNVFARRIGNPPDRRAPHVSLSARRRQHVLRRRAVILRVGCDEDCDYIAAGRSLGLGPVKGKLSAHQRTRVKLKLTRAKARSLRRMLKRRTFVRLRVSVTARDRAGNSATARRTIHARR